MKKSLILIFTISFFFCFTAVIFAQKQPQSPLEGINSSEIKKMEAREKEYLETLKKEDPRAYEKAASQMRRQKKIAKIIQDYYEKLISSVEAQSRLYPLVKENMQDRIANIDNDIEMLKEKLSDLEKAKKNPDFLIQKQIDQMLGNVNLKDSGLTIEY
jgi:GTP1/Obg family GTP-binding protein